MAWRNYSYNTIGFQCLKGISCWPSWHLSPQAVSLNVAIEPIAQSQSDPRGPRLTEEFGRLVWCAFQKTKSYMSTGIYWQLLPIGPVQSSLIVHVCSNSAGLSLMPWTLLPILLYSAQFTSTLVMHMLSITGQRQSKLLKFDLAKWSFSQGGW